MIHHERRRKLESKIWPYVQTPGQYVGGERNITVKDHRSVRGKLCIGFPDAYTIGMSHHGLQVLYSLMNRRHDWVAERVFAPWPDMEALLRKHGVPLYSLETFTSLADFDVVGLSLQYEISSPNVLTMIDLGGIPLEAKDRTMTAPLVVAGGPCCQNPEPMADFFDVMIMGDGEPALPEICDAWLAEKDRILARDGQFFVGETGVLQREDQVGRVKLGTTDLSLAADRTVAPGQADDEGQDREGAHEGHRGEGRLASGPLHDAPDHPGRPPQDRFATPADVIAALKPFAAGANLASLGSGAG